MLNYKLVVERTLHVETPRGLALLSVGDEVFLKLHGYGWLFGTIIALGHDTMLVAGHDLDESKRVAYRWITDVRDTAPDGETWNKVGDEEPWHGHQRPAVRRHSVPFGRSRLREEGGFFAEWTGGE